MCDDEPAKVIEEEEECVCTPKEKPVKSLPLDTLPCTCPYDPRFPNTNQSRRCVVNFIDYQRCTRLLGSYQGCRIFKLCYTALCPGEWINRWTEDLEKGTFPFCIYPPKPDHIDLPDESEPFDTTGY